jgi:hypothetical protein
MIELLSVDGGLSNASMPASIAADMNVPGIYREMACCWRDMAERTEAIERVLADLQTTEATSRLRQCLVRMLAANCAACALRATWKRSTGPVG